MEVTVYIIEMLSGDVWMPLGMYRERSSGIVGLADIRKTCIGEKFRLSAYHRNRR